MNVLNATQLFILKCLDMLCEFHLNKKKYITKKVTGKQVYQTNQAERDLPMELKDSCSEILLLTAVNKKKKLT